MPPTYRVEATGISRLELSLYDVDRKVNKYIDNSFESKLAIFRKEVNYAGI